jgi:hypothetical protein
MFFSKYVEENTSFKTHQAARSVVKNLQRPTIVGLAPGVNPTIANYNASDVNFYNTTGSLACFENQHILFYFDKRTSLLQRLAIFGQVITKAKTSLQTFVVCTMYVL